MSDRNLTVWNQVLEECGSSLANDLWIAVVREVATHQLFGGRNMVVDEEEKEEEVESLIGSWLSDSLSRVHTHLLDIIGEADFFTGISEPWYEIFLFTGEACGWNTSDVIYSLELSYSHLEGEITHEMVEEFYQKWRARFLSRILHEASSVKK